MATKAMLEQAKTLGVAVDDGTAEEDPTLAAMQAQVPEGARRGPRPAATAAPMVAEDDDYVSIRDEETAVRLPHIPGGRVIYLGPSKRKSISMSGIIQIERWETQAAKIQPAVINQATGAVISPEQILEPAKFDERRYPDSEGGNCCYDFSTHDARGRIINVRIIGASDKTAINDPRLRGKTWSRCEHPEHLRRFHRARDANRDPEFLIQVPRRYQEQFERWVRDREAGIGRQASLQESTIDGRAGG